MTPEFHILLVEDDAFLREGLETLLVREGFAVRQAKSIREAKEKLSDEIHLIILDVGLPDGNGFSFCEEVRKTNQQVLILFLSARDEEYDVVRGFDLGGNDYIAKPFRSLELIARVRALLRRFDQDSQKDGSLIALNPSRFQVKIREETVQLTPTEFSLLHKLMANEGQTLTREQLLSSLWDTDGEFVDDNTLSVHIFRLREKIGSRAIETIRGVGYCFRGLSS